MWCALSIFRGITPYTFNHLIFNTFKIPQIQFDINVTNGVAIDIANDILPVKWMQIYPKCFIK